MSSLPTQSDPYLSGRRDRLPPAPKEHTAERAEAGEHHRPGRRLVDRRSDEVDRYIAVHAGIAPGNPERIQRCLDHIRVAALAGCATGSAAAAASSIIAAATAAAIAS